VTRSEKRHRKARNKARFDAGVQRRILERQEFAEWGLRPAWWALRD